LAAQEWNGSALWSLGTLYLKGDGVEKDKVKGFQYIRLSAEATGNPEGAFRRCIIVGLKGWSRRMKVKPLLGIILLRDIPALDSV